jgi:hypothetical protein
MSIRRHGKTKEVPMAKCETCGKPIRMMVSWKRFCSVVCRLESYYVDKARKAGRL